MMEIISKIYFYLVDLIWHPRSRHIQRQLKEFLNRSGDIQSVKIGPCRTWLLLLIISFTAANAGAFFVDEQFNKSYGIIGALFGLVLGILLMLKFRTTLELARQGVTLSRGKQSVFIPWKVFNSHGGYTFMPNWKLVLSSQPEFYSQVQQYYDGELTESGRAVKTDFFKVLEQSQIEIDNGFGLSSAQLAAGLLQAAGQFQSLIDSESSQTATPNDLNDDNENVVPHDDIVYIDSQGRLVIGVSHVRFPELCFCCNGSSEMTLPLRLNTSGLESVDNRYFDLSLPSCKKCMKAHRFQMLNGSFTLWGGVGLVLCFLYMLLFGYIGIRFDKMWYLPIVAAFVTTLFLRFKIGRIPVYLFTAAGGNFSFKKKNISLKLKNTSFAKATLKYILETS